MTEANQKLMKSSTAHDPITDLEILSQSFLFLIAGYETTATTLAFLFYSFATVPETQEKLLKEIKENINSDGTIPYEKLIQLPYMDACISEALRLYQPLMVLERVATRNTKIENIEVEKGTYVQVPVFTLHHNEEFWPDAFRFDPERFMPENKDKIVPYTYLPFGGGPRSCIGMRFALVEIKLALVELLQKYEFIVCEDTQIPLKFNKMSPMLQTNDIIVKVKFRI